MANTIFIQMAAYRDAQAQWTVLDALQQADCPDAIRVGICWQGLPGESCFDAVPCPSAHQVRVISVDARQTHGANWARSVAGQLYRGESHVLLVDAHMRFEPGWDTALFETLDACPSPRSLLSAFLPSFAPPRVLEPPLVKVPQIKVNFVTQQPLDAQIVHLTWRHWAPQDLPDTARPTPFVVQNFMFMPAAVLQEVPIDPHFFFYGDELSLSARLFTAGWDVYQPTRRLVYHQWRHRDTGVSRDGYRSLKADRQQRAAQRLLHLLALRESTDVLATRELELYGLGTRRSLTAFADWSGVDLVSRHAQDWALAGEWSPTPVVA